MSTQLWLPPHAACGHSGLEASVMSPLLSARAQRLWREEGWHPAEPLAPGCRDSEEEGGGGGEEMPGPDASLVLEPSGGSRSVPWNVAGACQGTSERLLPSYWLLTLDRASLRLLRGLRTVLWCPMVDRGSLSVAAGRRRSCQVASLWAPCWPSCPSAEPLEDMASPAEGLRELVEMLQEGGRGRGAVTKPGRHPGSRARPEGDEQGSWREQRLDLPQRASLSRVFHRDILERGRWLLQTPKKTE
uniref:Uncharacterized protein n=1 Tax=Pipistrellus kuhlii TaxID=59472 RepID=A0A7J7UTH0_PIPKU|nr:hypothetical protein mPipKuh1_008689 [Pipistrellus kuhlii]